jgi:CTD nuclear envelope phosphatase 1
LLNVWGFFLHLRVSFPTANGIPIEGWINDPHDEALLDLLPVLDSLRFTKDVRRVLGIRGFGHIP